MKLEFYFITAFIIVYNLVDVHFAFPEFQLTFAIIPLLLIQIGMTIYFTKRENKLGALAALVSFFIASDIVDIFKLTRLCRHYDLARSRMCSAAYWC